MDRQIDNVEIEISAEFKLSPEGEEFLDRLEKIDGTHNVPVTELFSPEFMKRYSTFLDFETMVKKSGFEDQILDDFSKIPAEEWDEYISKSTEFSSWEEMKNTAAEEWAKTQLEL